MKATDFNRLSVDELLGIREAINEILTSKIGEERRNLELRMATLDRLDKMKGPFSEDSSRHAKIPAKYQNPDNPLETWAGRGKTPRWMAAALKRGKKREDFLIDNLLFAKSRRR